MESSRHTKWHTHTIWRFVIGFLVVLALLFVALRAAGAAEPEEPSYWMKKKMEYSEKILAGLAKADFEAIEKNAKSMNALSQIEKWVQTGSPGYQAQLAALRSANKSLMRTAQEKDVDGASLAFMQLTLSCVQCHKIIRDSGK